MMHIVSSTVSMMGDLHSTQHGRKMCQFALQASGNEQLLFSPTPDTEGLR